MFGFVKSLNEKQSAFIIVLLITVVYFFPVFQGKIDVPVDVRDVLMYPWRYHAVDKKIKSFVLWKKDVGKNIFKLDIQPKSKSLNPSNSNFSLTFDFKSGSGFRAVLIDEVTQESFIPPYTVLPANENKWQKAFFNLNELIKKTKSMERLHKYNLILEASDSDSLVVKNLILTAEDFSDVPKIHNSYINDLIQMFVPFREYYSNSLKKGKIPYWNNYIFGGTEFLAEPQVGYFHPFYLLCYLIFDHFTAHSFIIFACFVLCGFGAFLLSRFWGLGFAASVLTAMVYMFQPFNITWLSYEHMLMNSATLPYLLLCYEKNLSSKKLLNKYLLFSAFLLGLIFLSGHLQYIYYTFIFFFLFVCFKSFTYKMTFLNKQIISTSFIFLIGIMMGSIVLISFFPLLQNSHRVINPESFIELTSFPVKAFLGLICPFYGGPLIGSHTEVTKLDPVYVGGFFNNYIYFGILPFFFSLLGFTLSFKRANSYLPLLIFFVTIVVSSFLISTGSPVFFLIREVLPGFKQMQHFRFLELYSYSVPFLAGIGFQVFLNHFLKINKYLISLILILTVIDLMFYSSFFMTWADKKDYKPLHSSGALEFLKNEQKKQLEPFRVLPFAIGKVGETELKVNVAQPNTLLPYEIEDASGYSSFIPSDIYNLFVYVQSKNPELLYKKEMINLFTNPNIPFPIYNFKSKILDLLNIKYFMIPKVLTLDSKKVYEGDSAIYENEGYLPRAYIVQKYRVIKSSKDTIIELDSERFNPREEVILMTAPSVILRRKPKDLIMLGDSSVALLLQNDISFLKYEPNQISLKATVNTPCFLVLGNNLNNNWDVKINGNKKEHLQANLVQRAVYLPNAGKYLIEFKYNPRLFLIGILVSLFAVVILIFLALYLGYANKNERKLKNQNYSENGKVEKIKVNV